MTVRKRYPSTVLATACIPWDEHGRFDEPVFRRQVRALLARGVNHVYLFGTAGEGYAVTEDQFVQIVRTFAEEMNGPDRYPMVGLISLSLPEMIRRMEIAYAHGIRDFQFTLPSWGALSDRELEQVFHTVCGRYPDCRYMHYNLARAKRVVTPEEYVRLADDIPNLVGAKYTTSDSRLIYRLIATPSPLQFFLGETGFLIGSLFGECGLLVSLGVSRLSRVWEIFHAAKNKDFPRMLQFYGEVMGMTDGLFSMVGTDLIDGAYDKMFIRTVDPSFPLRLLPPYTAATEAQFAQYVEFLRERYPQWLEHQVPGDDGGACEHR